MQKIGSNNIIYFSVGILFGILNALTVYSSIASALVAILEYILVYLFIINGRYIDAFKFFLLFSAVSLELDTFLFEESSSTLGGANRFYFTRPPIVHGWGYDFTVFLLYFFVSKKSKKNGPLTKECLFFKKTMLLLLVSGILSAIIGMLLNDNGIMASSAYPKVVIYEIDNFIVRFLLILTALEMARNSILRNDLCGTLIVLLAVVAISSAISGIVFNMKGRYGLYEIMLSPLTIAYTPCLITLFKEKRYGLFALLIGFFIIIVSLFIPTAIGSKWYLIILFAGIGFMIFLLNVKSIVNIGILGLLSLVVIVSYSESILGLFTDDYAVWKFSQSLNVINFSGSSSGSDWYSNLDHSTLYRIDEPANIFIEYSEKPFYSIFGKGFGGTIRHHTTLLSWETDAGAFSDDQIKIGAYYQMHESLSVLLLRHGILGLFFFLYYLYLMIRKFVNTPWSFIAVIWLLFYWSYGMSLAIGGIAMVLALSQVSSIPQK